MQKSNLQKIKLLYLWQMLYRDSDERHPLTTRELCLRLNALGISCDRRTLAKDIALLNSQGFEVMSLLSKHDKVYYVDDRSFSVPELKILMDAVQAAHFITPKKTEQIIKKLSALHGSGQAAELRSHTICFNSSKRSNEEIYYTVSAIEEALELGKKVSFFYFYLDEHRERVYRRDKTRYTVEPVGLVLQDDRYYLLAISPHREGKSIYRLDRMEQAQMEPEPVSEDAAREREGLRDYTGQLFQMYAGEPTEVELRFSDAVLEAVYDEFGEALPVRRVSDTECTAKVSVQISPTFWGWLFQFAGKIRISGPEELKQQYANLLRDALASGGENVITPGLCAGRIKNMEGFL